MAGGIGDGLYIELGTIGDTKELEKFVKMCRKTADAIEDATKKQDEHAKSIKKTTEGIAGFVTAIAGAAIALNKLTNDLVKNNQTFLNLTRQSDIALSTFQKWDGIGKIFGIENAANQLENLNQKLFELRLTGQGARGFQLAGIDPTGQNAEGVLEQLRARIQGMDNTTASYLLQQMGLDPRMISILRMDRKEFEELGATIKKYQLTDAQRQQIEKLNIQLQIAGQKFQYLKQRALLAIMPYLTEFMSSLARIAVMFGKVVNWFIKGSWASKGFLAGVAGLLIKFEGLRKLITSIGVGLSGFITKLPIIGTLFRGLGAIVWRAMLPLTAIFLLLDDLATYFEGGDSLIGRVIEWGSQRGGEIADAFKKMFGGDFWGGANMLGGTSEQILDDIFSVLEKILSVLTDIVTGGAFGKFKGWVSSKGEGLDVDKALQGFFQALLTGDLIHGFAKFQEGMAMGGASAVPSYEELLGSDPNMVQSVDNSNTISNANKTVNMKVDIQSNQPAEDTKREMNYAMAAASL